MRSQIHRARRHQVDRRRDAREVAAEREARGRVGQRILRVDLRARAALWNVSDRARRPTATDRKSVPLTFGWNGGWTSQNADVRGARIVAPLPVPAPRRSGTRATGRSTRLQLLVRSRPKLTPPDMMMPSAEPRVGVEVEAVIDVLDAAEVVRPTGSELFGVVGRIEVEVAALLTAGVRQRHARD